MEKLPQFTWATGWKSRALLVAMAFLSSFGTVLGQSEKWDAVPGSKKLEETQHAVNDFLKEIPGNPTLLQFLWKISDQDGMTAAEELELVSAMKKVVMAGSKYSPYAQAVLDKIAQKESRPPLVETTTQKKSREDRAKWVEAANIFLNNPQNYKVGPGSSIVVDTKTMLWSIIFSVSKNNKKMEEGEIPNWWMSADFWEKATHKLVPWKKYRFRIDPPQTNETLDKIPLKDNCRIIFFGPNWKKLNLAGEEDKWFWVDLRVWSPQDIAIPPGCTTVTIKYDFTLQPDWGWKFQTQRYKSGILAIEDMEGNNIANK